MGDTVYTQFDGDLSEFEELLNDAEDEANNQWEDEFVESMRERWETHRGDTYLSDAQLETLRKIAGGR